MIEVNDLTRMTVGPLGLWDHFMFSDKMLDSWWSLPIKPWLFSEDQFSNFIMINSEHSDYVFRLLQGPTPGTWYFNEKTRPLSDMRVNHGFHDHQVPADMPQPPCLCTENGFQECWGTIQLIQPIQRNHWKCIQSGLKRPRVPHAGGQDDGS